MPSHPSTITAPDSAQAGVADRHAAIRNRLDAILLHIPQYSFEGASRLARDVRVSRSTVCRMLRGTTSPSYRLVEKVTAAVSSRLGKQVDARELFTTDGTYPTPSACDLCGCRGCLPPWAWDEDRDALRPGWKDARPGDWSRSSPLSERDGIPTDNADGKIAMALPIPAMSKITTSVTASL